MYATILQIIVFIYSCHWYTFEILLVWLNITVGFFLAENRSRITFFAPDYLHKCSSFLRRSYMENLSTTYDLCGTNEYPNVFA